MTRLSIAIGGLAVGAALGPSVSACTYFDCQTIDHPVTPGTYGIAGRSDYQFVLGIDGTAVETYTEGSDAVRAEYSVARAAAH